MRILDLILFVDGYPALETAIAVSLILISGALAISPLLGKRDGRLRPWWQHPLLFIVFLGLSLFACRLPVLLFPLNLNPDEAQLVAEAITYQTHPIPWRDIDGGTAGPLDSYSVLWCAPFGLQPSYYSARTSGLFCVLGMMGFLYLAGRGISGDVLARISILPTFVFVCFATAADYTHYSTEQFSLFLIAWALYLLVCVRATRTTTAIVGFGLIIGLLPFAKLQSALPGAALAVGAMWLLVMRRRNSPGKALTQCGVLTLAILLPGVVILSIVASCGALYDFWESYIEVARTYGSHYSTLANDIVNKINTLYHVFIPEVDMAVPVYLMIGIGGIAGICLVSGKFKASQIARDWYGLSIFFVATMFATVAATNLPFYHYLSYLLPAFGFLALASFRILRSWTRKVSARRLQAALGQAAVSGLALLAGLALFVIICPIAVLNSVPPLLAFCFSSAPLMALVGLFALGAWIRPNPIESACQRRTSMAFFVCFFLVPMLLAAFHPNPYRGYVHEYLDHLLSPMDEAILRVRPPGGRLAILGWAPEYAAETGTPLGTRDAISQYVFNTGPLQNYYRQRYLRDMRTNRPELFLEATVPSSGIHGFVNSTLVDINDFPDLVKYVADQYRFADEIDGMRLFVRKDLNVPDAKSTSAR